MSLHPYPVVSAMRMRLSSRHLQRVHLLWAGEVLFVAGWSLMWAASLALTPWIPVWLCIGSMIGGLTLFAAQSGTIAEEPKTGP